MASCERAKNGSDLSLFAGSFPRKLGGGIQTSQKPGGDSALGISAGGIRLHGLRRRAGEWREILRHSDAFARRGAVQLAPFAQFIVPNPFKSRRGRTKTGKPTNKSDSQVSCRRFVVIEFDFRAFDWTCALPRQEMLVYQARLHWHLANEYPLCLLVYSGNESLHGWYATVRPAELMHDAAALGADTRLWSLSQFTRMPWGGGPTATRQRVVFFKP